MLTSVLLRSLREEGHQTSGMVQFFRDSGVPHMRGHPHSPAPHRLWRILCQVE